MKTDTTYIEDLIRVRKTIHCGENMM